MCSKANESITYNEILHKKNLELISELEFAKKKVDVHEKKFALS